MDEYAIRVQNIYKKFRIFHEKRDSLYESITGLFNRRKHYEVLPVLNGISFDVKKGEIFGIIGKNGMGKTTLLRILSGIYKPDSGDIHIDGNTIPFLGLGAGFQAEMTARDNVILYGKLLGISRNHLQQSVKEVMEYAELKKFADTKLKNFSAGMYARLAFATAVKADPDIILMDEILSVGDIGFQKKCHETFRTFRKRQKTVILVSHDLSAIKENCERVMLLDKGKIVKIGNPDQVIEQYHTLFNEKNDDKQ